MAYDRIDPFGQWREDLRSAMICAVMANAFSGKGKSYSAKDFMPKFEPPKRQTPEQMMRMLQSISRKKK